MRQCGIQGSRNPGIQEFEEGRQEESQEVRQTGSQADKQAIRAINTCSTHSGIVHIHFIDN